MPRIVRRRGRVLMALGADEAQPGTTLSSDPITDMADTLRGVRADLADAAKREQMQRYLQLLATLSIPVAAYLWKWILGKRRSKEMHIGEGV